MVDVVLFFNGNLVWIVFNLDFEDDFNVYICFNVYILFFLKINKYVWE